VSDIVRDVMSPSPRILGPDATLMDAALVMRREDIGDGWCARRATGCWAS
jgi:hypothetical protein